MRVPECELLAAVRRTEGIIDVEYRLPARLHCRTDLIKQGRAEPCCLRLARRILQAADGRLRGQRRIALRTAPDRDLHQRIMPQPIEVDGILMAASNRTDARRHHFEHLVLDAARIAAIGHRSGKPRAYSELAVRLSQQQQTAVG